MGAVIRVVDDLPGRSLHVALQQPRASVRAAACEEALATFARDRESEVAHLSTLVPVDDAPLVKILRGSAVEGSAEDWMAALRQKAAAIVRRRASRAWTGGASGLRDLGGLESTLAKARLSCGGEDLYPTWGDGSSVTLA